MEQIKKHFWPWQFDEEELWLNKMTLQGKGLQEVSGSTYTFAEEEPGTFIYRLAALRHSAGSDKGRYEIEVLEEDGWILLATRGKWAYVKRSVDAGRYDVREDADNKYRRLKPVRSLLILLAAAVLITAFCLLLKGMVGAHPGLQYAAIGLFLLGMLIMIVIIQVSGTLRWLKNRRR